ncbi:hypothetical protein [Pseudomonas citrulli]|uniref:Uncharacterized protein n=1 Tax=Pseudomonas citrulli TaxID=3064347 RepID=A0ABT9C070_9PSED|nr:hypothetical protein [Pseudomonas sp. K18]MDO7896474.1 hypothetical protein [Pseudomonas sp. K18]
MNDRVDFVVAVKQLFETYVYAQTLSRPDLLPFVIGFEKSRARAFDRLEESATRLEKD